MSEWILERDGVVCLHIPILDTFLVEMCIWCIKIGNAWVLHSIRQKAFDLSRSGIVPVSSIPTSNLSRIYPFILPKIIDCLAFQSFNLWSWNVKNKGGIANCDPLELMFWEWDKHETMDIPGVAQKYFSQLKKTLYSIDWRSWRLFCFTCAKNYITFLIMTFSNTVFEIRTLFARNGFYSYIVGELLLKIPLLLNA
jgi:hypothetical protein